MSDYDYSDGEDYAYSNDSSADPKRHARSQHNELERRRRNNIKDMYNALKDSIPGMQNERASRAVILKKAVELISSKKSNLDAGCSEIKDLENEYLELQKEWAALENNGDCPQSPAAGNEAAAASDSRDSPVAPSAVPGETSQNRERHSAFDDFVPKISKTRETPEGDYIDITDLS